MTDIPEKKPRRPYKDGNVDENGKYIVGKCQTPESGKFRVGDGRQRGRRPRGTQNLKTDFAQESTEKITIREGGKTKKVSKQRVIIKRLHDSASKGQHQAMRTYFDLHSRLIEDAPAEKVTLSPVEQAILAEIQQHMDAAFSPIAADSGEDDYIEPGSGS